MEEYSSSKSSSSSAGSSRRVQTTNTVDLLKQNVQEYKKLYSRANLTAWILLVCVVTYTTLLFFEKNKIISPLAANYEAGDKIATDSSGKLLALPVYNQKDSAISIVVSVDSGAHFKQYGPWKNVAFDSIDKIHSIVITKDSCIIAAGSKYVYLKPAARDSFTCINVLKNSDYFNWVQGFCFVPGTDSVYIYTNSKNIFAFKYKHYDSVTVGEVVSHSGNITSMAVSATKQIAIITDSLNQYGVELNCTFSNKNIHAVTEYLPETGATVPFSSPDSVIDSDTLQVTDSAYKPRK